MDSLGNMIKKLRESKQLSLETVAACIGTDPAVLSKIEQEQTNATREQVVRMAEYFKVKEADLLVAWLADKVMYEVEDEEVALQALQVAEEKVAYKHASRIGTSDVIQFIRTTLKNDDRVTAAWLYGSVARGEDTAGSDVDMIVELNSKKKYSMFDLIDIAYNIEQRINRKVDIAERGQVREFAMKTASKDLIKIYG